MGIENLSAANNEKSAFKYEVRMGDSIRSIAEKSLFAQGKIQNDGKFDGKVTKENEAILQKEIAKIKAENKKALHHTKTGTEYFIACDSITINGDVENVIPIDSKTEHPNKRKNVEVTSDKFKGMPVLTYTLKKGDTLEGKNGVLYERVKQLYAKEQTVTLPDGTTKKYSAVTDEEKLLKITEEYSSAIIGAENASERDTRKWQAGKVIEIPVQRMDIWTDFAGKEKGGNRKFAPTPAPNHKANELPEVVVSASRIKPKDKPNGVSQKGFYNLRTDNILVDTPWGKIFEGQVVPPYIFQQ